MAPPTSTPSTSAAIAVPTDAARLRPSKSATPKPIRMSGHSRPDLGERVRADGPGSDQQRHPAERDEEQAGEQQAATRIRMSIYRIRRPRRAAGGGGPGRERECIIRCPVNLGSCRTSSSPGPGVTGPPPRVGPNASGPAARSRQGGPAARRPEIGSTARNRQHGRGTGRTAPKTGNLSSGEPWSGRW